MIEKSEKIDQIATALSVCQSSLRAAHKDMVNPYFKSKYADLESVWEACRESLALNGLSVSQFPGNLEGHPTLTTLLMHRSGQWLSDTVPLNPVKNDPQSLGSAITYMRRYALAACVGIVQSDDDGHEATKLPLHTKEKVGHIQTTVIPVGGPGADKSAATPKVSEPSQLPTPLFDDRPKPGDFKITLGNYTGLRIKDIPEPALRDYMDKLKTVTHPGAKEILLNVMTYLDSLSVK